MRGVKAGFRKKYCRRAQKRAKEAATEANRKQIFEANRT
jgi:hypothetical protein